MKKLIFIAIAFISIQGFAQQERKERPNRGEMAQRMNDFTPEEIANLRTKKMTLQLDLNDAQQKEIYKLNLDNASKRKAMMEAMKAKKESGAMEKPTKEEHLKMMNTRLDHQIAMKAKMKSILNKEQFEKWEKAQSKMAEMRKEGMKGKKRQGEWKKPEGQKKI